MHVYFSVLISEIKLCTFLQVNSEESVTSFLANKHLQQEASKAIIKAKKKTYTSGAQTESS